MLTVIPSRLSFAVTEYKMISLMKYRSPRSMVYFCLVTSADNERSYNSGAVGVSENIVELFHSGI